MADEAVAVALVHSHHLLDHKPDNLLLKGGKHKLRGVACLGRPGVALCIGSRISIQNFQASLEASMPQKKFETTELNVSNTDNIDTLLKSIRGFEKATLGQLRELLTGLGSEGVFFELTGLDPGQASTGQATTDTTSQKKGKKRKKKKK